MRLVLATLLLAACSAGVPLATKQRGISFAAAHPRFGTYGTEQSAAALDDVRNLGADWISIMPFGFHSGTPDLRFGGARIWETDESLAAVTRQAHERGLKVMLKLHVWGRAELKMDTWTASEWRAWFDDYGNFVEHYARIARDTRADALCIGNEQKIASRHEAEWRRIIARARAIYDGPITYGANFDEVFDVPFWDAVDWIGVSGYFPLDDAATPDRATLIRAWQPVLAKLEALATKRRKPVLFTEIGYRSADGAAWRQWEIARDAPLNPDAQRIAYEAFFETVWPRPWVAGAYPWKWFSYRDHGSATSNDYDFENKPAADVIRRAYTH
ncbi:MAG TPA: hypothetical protein VHK90_09205 [Thermoanaerobaculia bacterium]|nr:hypothetical protein [Thermoanaerobaculia bacterium]